ncbi:MAG: biopolymer transport protein ExbB [Candidatus Azotimanducaceae bacterium]|jgi:biopolymer transport protein ExbB|tara:strand:- start:12358 stop:12975 length:618 start_codon:yes stop_codon:yes gene_type:complete
MLDIVITGGWLMLPILLCSVVVGAICLERWWTLRREEVIPAGLLSQLQSTQEWSSDNKTLAELAVASPLGFVIAAGLNGIDLHTEAFQRVMQSTIDNVAHELERYLTLVGIIASITPLMGILGTVFGMIDVFSTLVSAGQGDAKVLAGGISTALVTSAAGLSVAIPALIAHRFFLRKVDELVLEIDSISQRFFDRLRAHSNETSH